jgi:hypothetical protein
MYKYIVDIEPQELQLILTWSRGSSCFGQANALIVRVTFRQRFSRLGAK